VNPTRLPQLGSVVWAELADPNDYRKIRPAVILTASAEIGSGGSIRVSAITTRIPTPLPRDYVMLPWDPEGKARSGLRRKCAAVATWLAEIRLEDVKEVVGLLPPSAIAELLGRVADTSPRGGNA
jgi:mRNA-degrading endonuclease toxin of MazEF toxin-antitoxin module